jgi:hypothetical protein
MVLYLSLLTLLAIVALVLWLLRSGNKHRERFHALLKSRGLQAAPLPIPAAQIFGRALACYQWRVELEPRSVEVHWVTASASTSDDSGQTLHLTMTAIIPAAAAKPEVVARFRQALSWKVAWRNVLSYRAPRPQAVDVTPEGNLLVRWNLLYRADVLGPRLDLVEAVLRDQAFPAKR